MRYTSTSGLEDIKYLRQLNKLEDTYVPHKAVVGAFGINDGERDIVMLWIVGDRKDRRHGNVERPVKLGAYNRSLLRSMFRGWH